MAVVRVCFVFVLIVCISCIAGKPIFTRRIMCDWFCDDDDLTSTSTSTTTSSSEEYYDWFIDCRTDCRRPTTLRPGPPTNPPVGPGGVNPATQMPINFMFAGGQPMNVTMQNQGNNWMMYVVPGTASATPSPTASAAPAGAPPAPAPAAAPAPAPAPAAAPAGGGPGDAVAAPSETATTAVASPTTVATPSA